MAGEEGKVVLLGAEQKAATEPMEVGRQAALLKRKAEEEIYKIPVTADGESTEPQAEGGIKEAVHPEGYGDEAEYRVRFDAAVYEDEEEEYEYEEEEECDYEPQFKEQRPKVRAMVLSFPEAENMKPEDLDEAVERILEQSKPKYDNEAAQGKIRLLREDIELAVDQWEAPPPSVLLDWFPDHILSEDSIRRYEELDKEFLPLYGTSDEERERVLFRAKVRKELIEKGFVEVDEDYYEKKDEYERQCMEKIQEEWDQKMQFRRSRVANYE